MRAFAKETFEDPGAVRELPDPEPAVGEVRIRVGAASVNPFDAVAAAGYLKGMMECRFPYIPGLDFSGAIDALGEGVTGFAVGDVVFGIASKPFLGAGTFAERVVVDQATVGHLPASIDRAAGSTAGLAAVTALMALELLELEPKQTLLVIGASGGVGSYAVQLAATRGARVIAVAGAERTEYLRGLGASETIDYTSADMETRLRSLSPDGIDALLDLASDSAGFVRLARQVKRGGRAATAAAQLSASDSETLGAQSVTATGVRGQATPERLRTIADALAHGVVMVPTLRTVSLEQAAQALSDAGSHHTVGKIVILL